MRPLGALALSLALLPAGLRAQYADPSVQLKQRLRTLVIAQEKYWDDHGTYTTDVSALGMFTPHRAGQPAATADSVWVQVVQAGGRSWWGRASIRGHNGKSCVIYIGYFDDFSARPTSDSGGVKAEREGEPACDAF